MAVSEWVTERVLCVDKTYSTGIKMSDPDILLQKKRDIHRFKAKLIKCHENWLYLEFFEVFSNDLC